MAATDQPYRNQKALDVVFGVSCGLMLLTTFWMFAQDYNRGFKTVQRTFRDIESTIAERELIDKLPDPRQLEETRRALAYHRKQLTRAQATVAPAEKRLQALREKADVRYREIKADLDSRMSFYNIAVDEAGHYPRESSRGVALNNQAKEYKKEVEQLEAKLAEAKRELDQIDIDIKAEVRTPLETPEKEFAAAEEEMKRLAGASDRFAKVAAQRGWSTGDTFRALPILDGFESPIKIKQLWLPDLTIDYGGFRDVPRYDRCTTCHLGIDRGSFDPAMLARLGNEEENSRLTAKLQGAKAELEKRVNSGENLGFSPDDLPGERQGSLWLITALMFACVVVGAGTLGILQQSIRLGMITLTAGLGMTLLTSLGLALFSPKVTSVKTVKLTSGEITQYAAHPRLDLFVDSNSPHSMEKFGCTICHAGQGSATEFTLASHTPNDAKEEHRWKKEYHYHSSHYWDFPMLSKRFVESSCLKCHHEVTDLIRHGTREEAPKLLRGYTLVKENGCFGCHEIHGFKSGREIGPDLRLEPTPALDYQTPADRERAKADPGNPPGGLRKVGPSLRRLSEKTSLEWTVSWINEPRGFRPDTRMPHFYNLSTNSKDVLPEDQKSFPATEIHAIGQYLIRESKNSLAGTDAYRLALLGAKKAPASRSIRKMQETLAKDGLSDRHMKDLFDISRRFVDLAILSAPTRSQAINATGQRQRNLQEKLFDLKKSVEGNPALEPEVQATTRDLAQVTDELDSLGKPRPLSEGVLNEYGDKVTIPAKEGDAFNGRVVFTEKGCLACHAHEGTQTKYDKDGKTLPQMPSVANFGPELSRIADKISDRTWLVQWLLNPTIYHPRTRMPVTHLTVDQANDVATWLLSQKTGWKGNPSDPQEPGLDDYRTLARVYLAKAPGVTRAELDAFLPAKGEMTGIPADRLDGFARDADERALEAGKVTKDSLAWYIGKKAIGRLGCFGCHDIPGFETAKPIGTGLNDWGKKEAEKLAFEDGAAFVRSHFNIVMGRTTPQEVEARIKVLKEKPEGERTRAQKRELEGLEKRLESQKDALELEKKALDKGLTANEQEKLESLRALKLFEPVKGEHGVREPFEEIFFEGLEEGHRSREGFLHLKLMEPRSYDYNRIRPWDDRLRMPQFKFARSRKTAEESDEAYQVRLEKEEAEAREAVMTFILGLVAEPIPLKYLPNYNAEKKAEILGRQTLDKYNCASCHQLRPGVFEFKPAEVQAMLDRSYNLAAGDNGRNFLIDHVFQGHNAWTGTAPTSDRQTALGYRHRLATEQAQDNPDLSGTVAIRLSDALRFAGSDRVLRDLPAGSFLYLPADSIREAPGYGGTWTEQMVTYLQRKDSSMYPKTDLDKPRVKLPPPLLREGERIQPDWLYKFLLEPNKIRPQLAESKEGILLRMPRFNMSPEESRAIVNYFSSVAKLTNAGAGVTAPFTYIGQREQEFWRQAGQGYKQSVQTQADAVARQVKELQAEIDRLKKDAGDAKKANAAKAALAEKEKALAPWQARAKLIQAQLDQKYSSDKEMYVKQAYKLVTHKDLCLKCHPVGNMAIENAQGPNLALAAERLRPEWMEEWIGNPVRMFSYNPTMPQNFPNQPDPLQWGYQDAFVGSPIQQTRAARDLLMGLPYLNDILPPTQAANGGSKK